MISLSQIINKKVISVFECEELGNISGIYVDKKLKCNYLVINKDNMQWLLKPNTILYINDVIIIKNKSFVNLKDNLTLALANQSTLLNSYVYNVEGNYMGIIKDVYFSKGYNTDLIILDNNEQIMTRNILNIANNMCIISTDTPHKISNFRPKSIPNHKQTKLLDTLVETCKAPEKIIPEKINPPPTAISTQTNFDYSKLLGRKINKNIISSNGEILFKAQTYITKDCIKKIKTFGKLYEILKFSE